MSPPGPRRRSSGSRRQLIAPAPVCEPVRVGVTNDHKQPVVPAQRRRMILELLRERGSISVAAVEERFDVSPMTARRDLALLADGGYARRTHGGAMLPELAGHEDSFQSRVERDTDVKSQLAAAVAATLTPNETIFIDSSSSAYFVVREILEDGLPLTLLTNSLAVMSLVSSADVPQIELIGIGGSFRRLTRSFVGAETVRMIERFFVDRIVFSVKGIETEGYLTDPDPLEAEVKRAMIDRARSVMLVAHAQKFNERGLNVIVPAGEVDTAFLSHPPATGTRILESAGVEVISV
jgi:DeoR/GlpR family transcriptional regulator of sugar metabolism